MSLIQVERLNSNHSGAKRRPLWLVWLGEQFLELKDIWQHYARRFGVDHWYRFAKQRLHWTLPNLSTPEQCERWSDLMPLITWQLWLAKDLVEEHRLRWQSPQPKLTPPKSGTVNIFTFSRNWLPDYCTQNPWKIPWLEKG